MSSLKSWRSFVLSLGFNRLC